MHTLQDKFKLATVPFTQEPNLMFSNEVSQELLPLFLSRTKEINPQSKLNSKILSNLFSNSVDLSHNYEQCGHIELENGWRIRGRMKHVLLDDNYEECIIYLPTILSTNRILEIHKQGRDHPLVLELAILNSIYIESNPNRPKPKLEILAIDRLYTDYKKMPTELFNFIPVIDFYSPEELIPILLDKTNKLQDILDGTTEPEKCVNLRWHRKSGISTPMQCMYYCNYSDNCPHVGKAVKDKANIKRLIF